jgi:RNA polymerase sigma factor (sigma-70 family)
MSKDIEWYKQQFAKVNLLSPSQVIELATRVRKWQDWPDGMENAPKSVARSGKKARDKLVHANMRLAFKLAFKRGGTGYSEDDCLDMFQEACVNGLTRAAEKFDPTLGYAFSTYAHWWIRQAINKWLQNKSRTIRMPDMEYQLITKARQVRRDLVAVLHRAPTQQEIADVMEVTVDHLSSILNNGLQTVSLESVVNGTDELSLIDTIASPDEPDQGIGQDIEDVMKWVDDLPEENRGIIYESYGIGCERKLLRQIGHELGITTSQVQARKASAMRQLRAAAGRGTINKKDDEDRPNWEISPLSGEEEELCRPPPPIEQFSSEIGPQLDIDLFLDAGQGIGAGVGGGEVDNSKAAPKKVRHKRQRKEVSSIEKQGFLLPDFQSL